MGERALREIVSAISSLMAPISLFRISTSAGSNARSPSGAACMSPPPRPGPLARSAPPVWLTLLHERLGALRVVGMGPVHAGQGPRVLFGVGPGAADRRPDRLLRQAVG